eukprot:scaffold56057_cov30-Cyclotella_meneghiniana.AAC.2
MGGNSDCGPQCQVRDCLDHIIQTIAAGLSQCLIMDTLNDDMQFGLGCLSSKGLHRLGLDWDAYPARVSIGWGFELRNGWKLCLYWDAYPARVSMGWGFELRDGWKLRL